MSINTWHTPDDVPEHLENVLAYYDYGDYYVTKWSKNYGWWNCNMMCWEKEYGEDGWDVVRPNWWLRLPPIPNSGESDE